MTDLTIKKTHGKFADRFTAIPVFEVTGGDHNFSAFVYMCRLNLDLDGASTCYGYDNPARDSVQHDLAPLETWKPANKTIRVLQKKMGVAQAHLYQEKVGLGNACGDPGDGTKGHKNFLAGSRNFYWAGVKALTKEQARVQNLVIDDRPELEAGLSTHAKIPVPKPVGSGWFPVINTDTGYYISGTSLSADGSASVYSSDHYLDSSTVPYAVWANNWNTIALRGDKLRLGDFGLAINNKTGASTPYVYGDSGTQNKVGESSKKLHTALGAASGLVTFIAFPGSGAGTLSKGHYHPSALGPDPNARIRHKVEAQMQKLGDSATNLAARLALGSHMGSATDADTETHDQERLHKNFGAALSQWVDG